MPRNENGHGGRQLGADDGHDVGDDEGSRTCEALVGMGCSAAAPAALVKAVSCDSLVGEVGKESIVTVDMVIKSMDEDDLGLWCSVGLGTRSAGSFGAKEGKLTSHVLVYKDRSPILWVPSTSVGILAVLQYNQGNDNKFMNSLKKICGGKTPVDLT
jgi:hypothetical protein